MRFGRNISDLPPVYRNITCHIIFDVNMGKKFRRKARFFADGHKTNNPAATTYSSVLSRELFRISLTIAVLNELDVLACDIQNTYLTSNCRERLWVLGGPEFGSEDGKNMLENFKLRDVNIEPPEVNIGATTTKMKLDNAKETYIYQLG